MVVAFNILYVGKLTNGSLQIMVYVYACTLQLTYLCTARPMVEPLYNYLEIFNEVTVTLVVFFLLTFTPLVPDPGTRSSLGWYAIGVTMTNVLINLLFIIFESLVAQVKKFKYNRRKKAFMKRYRAKREIAKPIRDQ
mmetsp:Transcript_31416/g.22765  ORF Transcript_31416/g.22765 Transcript_31416/m.22765 type:complete len:137 (+) Transcript_31416:1507-1917(+)